MTERKILTLKPKPKPKVIKVADPSIAQATAKTAKVHLTLEPGSMTRVDSIGKKQVKLRVTTADSMVFEMDINSKTYRKALNTMDELGADNCFLVIQGTLKPKGKVESAGLAVLPRTVKAEAAEESTANAENSDN